MKYSFEELEVWQKSRVLVKEVYLLLREFPKTEQYALCDQLRRAVVSVPSNIAEGNAKRSDKEKVHYFEIAYGSLMEVYCQMTIALDLNYITDKQLLPISNMVYSVSKMLTALRNAVLRGAGSE